MKRWRWMVVFVVSLLLFAGCARVSLDPCLRATPPVAAFRVSPETGELPILVTLDASDSFAKAGNIVEYRGDFGDGTTGNGPVVRHRFDRDPASPEEREFRVTLTVTQESATDRDLCRLTGQTVRSLSYGVSHPLNVARWEIKATYYGSLIEGCVRNESVDLRVPHGQVSARFYREPDHVLVGQEQTEIWDVRPGEERLFMIPTALRAWQFDWIELRTEAFTAQP